MNILLITCDWSQNLGAFVFPNALMETANRVPLAKLQTVETNKLSFLATFVTL